MSFLQADLRKLSASSLTPIRVMQKFCFSSPASMKKGKKSISGTPQYGSNKKRRQKGENEDKEAVQMAYSSHHLLQPRKDLPHDRYDTRKRATGQGLSAPEPGIAARGLAGQPDRRASGDLSDVGTTRTQTQYGGHGLLLAGLASVSAALAASGVCQTGQWSADDAR